MGAVAVAIQPQALALYERMCTAIAECSRVDEAKDIRDKAQALEAYYRQARNLDAEREAANVRLRAERRVGELLKDLARAAPEERSPGRPAGNTSDDVTNFQSISEQARCHGPSPYAQALADQGMSRQAAHRFQALADIPQERFEQALAAPEKPTTAGLLRHAEARREALNPAPTRQIDPAALTLWGELRDFERHGFIGRDCRPLLTEMTDAMRSDVRRLIPHVRDLLNELESADV